MRLSEQNQQLSSQVFCPAVNVIDRKEGFYLDGAMLPEGYRFVQTNIDPEEVLGLMRQLEIGKNLPDYHMQDREEMFRSKDLCTIDVGVRHMTEQLVGFSSLVHRQGQGILGDFVVSPGHQHQGIGKALIDGRLSIADQEDVMSLYIPELEPTNSLHSFYVERGFRPVLTGLVKGPYPGEIIRLERQPN